jgi:hypothetical protein
MARALSQLASSIALLGAFVILSSAQAFAAGGVLGTLRGTVVDAQTGNPIAGAAIAAVSPSGTFHATTDPHGFFVLLQLPTDTYALSVSRDGYASQVLQGITVLGDQTQSAGVIRLLSAARTLGRVTVTAHSPSSAFQPTQTVDETTFVGKRVDQALGEAGSTNYDNLVLSAPGVIATAPGSNSAISIRGSASVEIGYQFDGVDFRGSFFDENPDQGFLNGVGGGRGGIQVVSGAGDATQGGIGAGVINIIPGRGSYPSSGFMSFDVLSPYYDHSLAFQWGTASPDGRFSDFISTRSERSAPFIAPVGRSAADAGDFLGTSFSDDDDFLNNFYYRFGKGNDQEVQVLTDFLDHEQWAEYGGLAQSAYYPYNSYSYTQFQFDGNGSPMFPYAGCAGLKWYQSVIVYLPGVPRLPLGTGGCPNLPSEAPLTQPEEYIYGPTDFLKVGYTKNLNATTALNAFFYNWGGLVANNITGNSQDLTDGSLLDGYNNAGGRRVGFQAQLTKQASEKHTLTFVAKFENGFPYWVQQNDGNTWQGFEVGRSQDHTDQSIPGFPGFFPVSGELGGANEARIEDWYLPANTSKAVSAGNPCIGPAIDNGFTQGAPTMMGCYLYNYMFAHGLWHGRLPAVPTTGWNYDNTDFQQFGIGLRDQWSANDKLHFDYGVRLDGQNLKWALEPFNKDYSNTADVGLGYAALSNSYLEPRVIEPRFSTDFIANPTNSFRLSWGRSVSFQFGQTGGTPSWISNISPLLYDIPAKDSPGSLGYGGNPALGPACGSGWHPTGTGPNGTYMPNPYVYFSGQGVLNAPGNYFLCPNYAASIYWTFDQTFSAPDIGGTFPPTYNNWDLAWEHQFPKGWGGKLTAYTRRGYNTYQTTLLNAGPPSPVTGQETAGSFQERETGLQKAFGLEAMLTTPDRAFGATGFLTFNYINELTDTPPVAGSDSLPIVNQYLYQTGTLFHQSYLPPLSARAGIDFKSRSGWRINPIFDADGGEPFGVGLSSIGFVNGVLYSMPTCNIGICTPYAGPSLPNQSYNSACYLDPAYAGSYFNPKYYACRGDNEPALAGQVYTHARLSSDLDIEFAKGPSTIGLYITNVFNNYRGEPSVNPDWQPLATGVGGPQSGEFSGAYPIVSDNNNGFGPPYGQNANYIQGARDESQYDQPWLPYNEVYNPGITYRFYYQIKI